MFANTVKKAAIAAGVLLWVLGGPPAAVATIIGTDVSVSGAISFDSNFFNNYDPSNLSGTFGKTQGGTDTTSAYNQTGMISGSKPINADFTQVGDGYSMAGAVSESPGNNFGIGLDFTMDLGNASATDTYEVKIQIDFSNLVSSSGNDAYSESDFTIDDTGGEVFFTDIVSDTFFGNTFNGNPTGGFGGDVFDNGTDILTIILAPGGTETLTGAWTIVGGVFDPGTATADFFADVSILSVVNTSGPVNTIPEPGTFLLLGMGLLGISRLSRGR